MDITTLFDRVKSLSKKKNLDNKNFNGLHFWQPIKLLLSNTTYSASNWKNIPKDMIRTVMSIPEYTIDGYGDKNIIERNHFLIQTVRIPTSEKPVLRKIIQVALNIGQYQGKGGKSQYLVGRTKITDYISKKESEVKLTDILSKTIIEQLKKYLEK